MTTASECDHSDRPYVTRDCKGYFGQTQNEITFASECPSECLSSYVFVGPK